MPDTPNVTINNNFTTTEARDPDERHRHRPDVIDNGNGTVGLCTGSLINPRTVIFAAHCVNSRAATAYGTTSGGSADRFRLRDQHARQRGRASRTN